ncbi:hypothetical protein OAZ06_03175 [Synechococcus sp. AH-736-G20]|nr:hypothetical protein [Synechococcus sp. AH-736-G20]
MDPFNQVLGIDVPCHPPDYFEGGQGPVKDLFRDLHVLDGPKDLHPTTKFLDDQVRTIFLVWFSEFVEPESRKKLLYISESIML